MSNPKSLIKKIEALPAERVDEAVIAGEVTDFKKLYQFYETPPDLAQRMVAIAHVREGDRVLEPSAGRGAILKALPQTIDRTAVELNPAMAELHLHAHTIHFRDFLGCNGELGAFDHETRRDMDRLAWSRRRHP